MFCMKKIPVAVIALAFGAMAVISCQKEEHIEKLPTNSDTTVVNPEVPDLIEAVDLGLSVLWASCNVGAHEPEGYGKYFAWAETETKSYYDWETYYYSDSAYNKLTKYCNKSAYGMEDTLTKLQPADDAAHVRWGDGWRIPTLSETQALLDSCEWEWTELNGINGYQVTGPSGNSIFLPAAGYSHKDSVFYAGKYALFWHNALYTGYPPDAHCYSFSDHMRGNTYYSRNIGLSVRAVKPRLPEAKGR